MTILFTTGIPPKHLSTDERIVVRSQKIFLLSDTLYHKGADGIWRRLVRRFEKWSFFGNRIVELQEVNMPGKQQPRKYGTVAYGGRQS